MGYVANVARSLADVADSIVERNAIVLIHADSDEGVRRPVLLGVRAALFVRLEGVDALGVNLFDLVIRNIFVRLIV